MVPVLGLDFGNTIRLTEGDVLMPYFAQTIPVIKEAFGDNVFIVSRVNDELGAMKTIDFMHRNCLFRNLVPSIAHVRFCLKREDKAAIVASLGVTHFVDDRTQCLVGMGCNVKYALNPTAEQVAACPPVGMQVVGGWAELHPLLKGSQVIRDLSPVQGGPPSPPRHRCHNCKHRAETHRGIRGPSLGCCEVLDCACRHYGTGMFA